MNLNNKAEKLMELGLCDHCLGRQFAYLGHGLENYERGLIIRDKLEKGEEIDEKKFNKKEIPEIEVKNNCFLCNGIFMNIDKYVELIENSLKKYDFNTFLIGTRIPVEMQRKEDELWEKFGIDYVEPIKSELNRLIGKKLQKRIKKEVDFKRPDLNIIFDVKRERVEIKINSLFIYGKYNKYVRNLPQTRWPCRNCNGKGCEICDYTGKRYMESVEELIGDTIVERTKGLGTKFHGSGREDIDVKCYGKREFVIEIIEPEIRNINLKEIEKEINKKNKGRVEVFDLRFSDKDEVRELKFKKPDKTYRILVELDKEISNEELEKLKNLSGTIRQYTPERVEHRRAMRLRKRRVKEIKWKRIDKRNIELILRCEAGLYVKELITGDNGRTKPSVSEILNCNATWKEVDVMKIHY